MNSRIRLLGTCLALGGVVVLSGCVAYPASSYGYSEPYYADPSPVVVQPNVYIDGGGYYGGRPRYAAPYYGGRPGYYPRPGYPRPGVGPGPRPGGPRPGFNGGGRPGFQPGVPPGARTPQSNPRLFSSPDSRNQTPP